MSQYPASLVPVLLDAVIETSRDHLMITDANGRLVAANSSVCALYGLSRDELFSSDIHSLEAKGIFTPSVTLKVLASGQAEQVVQVTPAGRRMIADGFPVFADGKLVRVVTRSRDLTDLEEEYSRLQRQLDDQLFSIAEAPIRFEGIEASSKAMRELVTLLARVADTDASIVLLGESGVGKSALAQAIHGQRAGHNGGSPFVEINCAAIPDALFESEMFGYQPGAFSGASPRGKVGLIEQADGGTLFLDEIGELNPLAQTKLLQVLQNGMITRVGGTQPRKIKFRLIVATHQDLSRLVEEGRFRLDLYYRLNVIPVRVPPLRERREEIPALINRERQRLKERYGVTLSLDAQQWGMVMSHDWPGNVRELINYLERQCLTGGDGDIAELTVPSAIDELQCDASTIRPTSEPTDLNLQRNLMAIEKTVLLRAREQAGSTRAMAKLLGISQASVVRKLASHGLS